MGYPNYQVCKEVFLPFDESDDGITIEQYKEKYGIDLRDYFEFSHEDGIVRKPCLAKIYTIQLETGFVNPLLMGIYDGPSSVIILESFALPTYETYRTVFYIGVVVVDGVITLHRGEI